jgi:hypothetical protein
MSAFGSGLPIEVCRNVNGLAVGKWSSESYTPSIDKLLPSTPVIVITGVSISEGEALAIAIIQLIARIIAILTLRVWAVWEKSERLRVFLTVFLIILWASASTVAVIIAANQESKQPSTSTSNLKA